MYLKSSSSQKRLEEGIYYYSEIQQKRCSTIKTFYLLSPQKVFYYDFTTRKIYQDIRAMPVNEGIYNAILEDIESQQYLSLGNNLYVKYDPGAIMACEGY